MEERESLKKIVSHSKEYGFVIPSSEIYEGLNAVYDYAHNGVLLKNNIRDYWWKSMVQINQNQKLQPNQSLQLNQKRNLLTKLVGH